MAESTSSLEDNLAFLRQTIEKMIDKGDGPLASDALEAQARLELLAAALKPSDGQKNRLSVLYEVSRALGSSLQLDEVLNQAMDSVIQLTGAERGFLMLQNPISGELDQMTARNFERKSLDHENMQFSRTVIKEVMHTGEGIVTTNAQTDTRFAQHTSVMLYALRSILCVPLRVRGEITGVVYVDNRIKTGLFDEQDREMLEAFAIQAAVAILNARQFTQTDIALSERVSELETLQQIDRELNTGLDFERVLELTLDWAVRGTNAENGWIAIRSEDGTSMTVAAGEGKGTVINVSTSKLRPVTQQGEAIFHVGDTDELGPRLIVPARREGKTIALIAVQRQGDPFQSEAESFLRRLAEHAAVAIENTRLYKVIQDANLAKSQFVSIVAHELKVPMTSIRGYADLIRTGTVGQVTEQQKQFLETILSNVDRMASLVSDLSDISRIETGRLKIERSDVPLAQYIREVANILRPQIETMNQSLSLDLPKDLPFVHTDRTRLIQILTNLISNANKYTPDGGNIIVSAQVEEGKVRVKVNDTGIGISDDDLTNLFKQFFRSENPAVREQSGWGLGLHVTHRLIEFLGGEIGAESELGVGSTFWITLPIAK